MRMHRSVYRPILRYGTPDNSNYDLHYDSIKFADNNQDYFPDHTDDAIDDGNNFRFDNCHIVRVVNGDDLGNVDIIHDNEYIALLLGYDHADLNFDDQLDANKYRNDHIDINAILRMRRLCCGSI